MLPQELETATGVAHLTKSSKVSPALNAISTPMGLPKRVAALPMLIAKTVDTRYGTGDRPRPLHKFRTITPSTSIAVTSSMSADISAEHHENQ